MANRSQGVEQSGRKWLVFSILLLGAGIMLSILVGWGWRGNERANELLQTSTAVVGEVNILSTAKADVEVARLAAESQFELALARQLAGQAQSVFHAEDAKRSTAILLAAQSMKIFPTGDASQTLLDNTLAYPVFQLKQVNVVRAVAFSPNGKYFASASDDHFARVWDAATGQKISHMVHNVGASSVAFSPDSRYVISGGCDQYGADLYSCVQGSAIVWNAKTGKEIARVTHTGRVRFVGFSPDGQYAISGGCIGYYANEETCSDPSLRLWNISTGQESARIQHDHDLSAFSFRPDGQQIVTGGCDKEERRLLCSRGSIRIWDAVTGEEISRIPYENEVTSVAFSPEGTYIVAGSKDNTARVWEAATGLEQARMSHRNSVLAVLFSLDGGYAVSADENGSVRVWEAVTGAEVVRMQQLYGVTSLVLSLDGNHIATAGKDLTARVWEMSTGKEKARMMHDDSVTSIAFSPDGRSVISGSADMTVRVWKSLKGNEFARNPNWDLTSSLDFSPDGNYVVSGSYEGAVRMWELATGEIVTGRAHGGLVYSVAFGPDGQQVVSGSTDQTISLWEPFTGKQTRLLGTTLYDDNLVFSSDGKYVAAAVVRSILVWDASTQQEIIRIPSSDYVYSLTVSADGHYVVTAHLDHTVRIWEVSTGREISRLMEEGAIPSMAMSPDGRYLAAGGELAVNIWDLVTGQKVARLAAEDGITAVAFSPDGKYVITGGGLTARVWEVSSGLELARILHERVLSVAFSSEGEYALSGSYFDTVRVWKWRPEALIADACSRLTRNLTRMEWQQYIGNALPYQAVCPDFPIELESVFIPHTPTPTVIP